MMKGISSTICNVSCPAVSVKAVLSYGYDRAVRFFSALRFYFYYPFAEEQTI